MNNAPQGEAGNSRFLLCHPCCLFALVHQFHPVFERFELEFIFIMLYLPFHCNLIIKFYINGIKCLFLISLFKLQNPGFPLLQYFLELTDIA